MLQTKEDKIGVIYAASAYIAWGILPLYWHLLVKVPAVQLLSHRIVWSFVFVALLITLKKQWIQVKLVFHSWKNILTIVGSSICISANWFIYIWAVNNHHVIESSLGYYINPLLSILLGMFVFRERLNHWQWVALLCALTGVLVQTIEFGQVPWIALTLAITFGFYGLLKKLLQVESVSSFAVEMLLITPFCIGYLCYQEANNRGAIDHASIFILVLLLGTGVITASTLIWFAKGAKRVSLSTLGFLQFSNPTITLLLGLFYFHEHFSITNFISFAFIWIGLLIYSLSHIRKRERTVGAVN